MKLIEFIEKELFGWGKYEKILFPITILLVVITSFYMNDRPAAFIHAICGICATILAGKGKISCYTFGIIANLCYSLISFQNQFWGNFALNILYYLPMQFVGIYKWKNHLKKDSGEIYKTNLRFKERIFYIIFAIIVSLIGYLILKYFNDSKPFIDSVTTVFSIFAFLLTVKRCIEQWYFWTVVNGLCIIMWIGAYINGSHCFATILMWSIYFILGLYFLFKWKKDIQKLS